MIEEGSASTSEKIDAPVVVKPETVSKSASIKFVVIPEKRKGSEPKILSVIQEIATSAKPSRE